MALSIYITERNCNLFWIIFLISIAAKCEAVARDWLDNVYEVTMKALVANATQAEWSYNTNINAENADTSVWIEKKHIFI